MPCVRLNYEPIVLLATADACGGEADIQVAVLTDAKLAYYQAEATVTYVDVDASIVLFLPMRRRQDVRVVLDRDGRRNRLAGTFYRSDSGAIRCELTDSDDVPLVLTATGLRASDWRESTAA